MTLLWALWILFLSLDMLLVMVRASVLNVRMAYLVTLREQRKDAVERAIGLLEKPRVRVSLRLWVVLLHFLWLAVSIWLFALSNGGNMPGVGAGLFLVAITAAVLLAAEFLLEGIILPRAEELAVRMVYVTALLDRLLSPVSALLMLLLGSRRMLQTRMSAVTEDELKTWAQEEQAEGSLEQGERRMIYSIFQFGDTLAREVMIPRIDILALELQTPLDEAVKALSDSGHSRVPVYESSVDHIVGLLYAKDLLGMPLEGKRLESIRNLLRPVYFVPESKKVDAMLREMQSRSVHMAVVVDEYGGIAGLVTLEDIVEEIVGEIRDEYDQSEELLYEAIAPGEYRFQGRIDLDGFNEVMGTRLPKGDADTLGGYIYEQLGRIPQGGEQVDAGEVQLTVEQVSGRRIRTVRAQMCNAADQPDEVERENESKSQTE